MRTGNTDSRTRWFLLLLAPGLVLAVLAFRNLSIGELGRWIRDFGVAPLGLLALYEVLAWGLMGERWRLFCREEGARLPVLRANAARLAGFAWSYITPGPHLGGEPVQLGYLTRRGHRLDRLLPALLRDRGYEVLAGLLTASLVLVLPGGDRSAGIIAAAAALVLVGLAALPAVSRRAFRALAAAAVAAVPKRWRNFRRSRSIYIVVRRTLRSDSETDRSLVLRIAVALSLLLPPMLIVVELILFFRLSGTAAPLRSVLVLAAVSRIAHYAPIPGALGVYDAGMIGSAAWLGLDPVAAGGYVLFTRTRDLIQVGLGLMIFGTKPARS